jgi:hypothetical protein
LTQKHVFLAAPAYTGTVYLGTHEAIVGEILRFVGRGIRVSTPDAYGIVGNGDIRLVRATILAKFLATDATDLIFIDHDVQWPGSTLVKLLDYPVDFVAAIYPQRKDPISYSIRWLDKPDLWADPATGLLEVEGVSAGCLRLSRACCEKMVAAFPDSEFYSAGAPNDTAWNLFGEYRQGRFLISEDLAFCMRWRDIGGQVWIDPEITMGHTGPKTFTGSIGEWLRMRPAKPSQKESI